MRQGSKISEWASSNGWYTLLLKPCDGVLPIWHNLYARVDTWPIIGIIFLTAR